MRTWYPLARRIRFVFGFTIEVYKVHVDLAAIVFVILGLTIGILVGYAIGNVVGMTKARQEIIGKVKGLSVQGKIDCDFEQILKAKMPETNQRVA